MTSCGVTDYRFGSKNLSAIKRQSPFDLGASVRMRIAVRRCRPPAIRQRRQRALTEATKFFVTRFLFSDALRSRADDGVQRVQVFGLLRGRRPIRRRLTEPPGCPFCPLAWGRWATLVAARFG